MRHRDLLSALQQPQLGRFLVAGQTARQALQILQATGSRDYAISVASCLVAVSRAKPGQPDDALLAEAHERIGGRYFFDGYREVCEASP